MPSDNLCTSLEADSPVTNLNMEAPLHDGNHLLIATNVEDPLYAGNLLLNATNVEDPLHAGNLLLNATNVDDPKYAGNPMVNATNVEDPQYAGIRLLNATDENTPQYARKLATSEITGDRANTSNPTHGVIIEQYKNKISHYFHIAKPGTNSFPPQEKKRSERKPMDNIQPLDPKPPSGKRLNSYLTSVKQINLQKKKSANVCKYITLSFVTVLINTSCDHNL